MTFPIYTLIMFASIAINVFAALWLDTPFTIAHWCGAGIIFGIWLITTKN